MVDPVTTNILLSVPTRGSDAGTWDTPVNGNSLSQDGHLGGVQSIAVSNASFTLTAPAGVPTPAGGPTQAENAVLKFTGTVTAFDFITLPLPGYYIVDTLGLSTASSNVMNLRAVGVGETIALPLGMVQQVYCDGTNVRFVNLPLVGTYHDYAGATVPGWMTSCTVPPFLNCDGSVFSAVTYPTLALILGGTTLPDIRGTSRYALNQGTSRLTTAGSGLDGNTRFSVKTSQTMTLGTLNLPAYTPTGTLTIITTGSDNILVNGLGAQNLQGGTTGFGWSNNPTVKTLASSLSGTFASSSFGGNAQGGTSTPFGVVGTGTVHGITLIRAG